MTVKNFGVGFPSVLLAFLFVLPFSLPCVNAAADDGIPLVSFQVRPNAFLSSDFCQRLIALPELEPCFTAFTDTIDRTLSRELTRDRLDGKLPDAIADDISKCVERGISSRRVVESFFEHVETIVFEAQADIGAVEIDENSIANLLRSGKIDVKVDIAGVLGTVIDVNPRQLAPVLKYLKEGTDYEFLKNDPDGDFVIKFNFRFHEHKIGFCCAGAKLSENRYALLFSGKHDIDDYVKRFKDGRYDATAGSPIKEITLAEPCFHFLDRQRKKAGVNAHEADFISKIKLLKATVQDVDGVSQIELSATLGEGDDAKALRDMLGGLIALVQFTQTPDNPVIKMLQSVAIDVRDEKFLVTVKLDNEELWKQISNVLTRVTEEVKKQ